MQGTLKKAWEGIAVGAVVTTDHRRARAEQLAWTDPVRFAQLEKEGLLADVGEDRPAIAPKPPQEPAGAPPAPAPPETPASPPPAQGAQPEPPHDPPEGLAQEIRKEMDAEVKP